MPTTSRLLACLLAATALAAGCSSTPPTRFHSLLGGAPATPARPATPWHLDLGPVSVPAAVDQPQWVVRLPDDSLRMLEQERWVAPLRDELRAALLDGLQQRWGAIDTRNASAPAGQPAWRVRVDIVRFESVSGQAAWLDARWSAARAGSPPAALSCAVSLQQPAAADAMSLAAAHRRAVSALADRIGASVTAGACDAPAKTS